MSESNQTAVPSKESASKGHGDLISFLAVAQECGLEFLPVAWQSALDSSGRGSLGSGGTAEVSQSLVTVETSYAFKRMSNVQVTAFNLENKLLTSFASVRSELLTLNNPAFRDHPNIINMEGICWEIMPIAGTVWPVLVFKKAEFGDLYKFLDSEPGGNVSMDTRIGICVDVARGIAALHASGIVNSLAGSALDLSLLTSSRICSL
jgi:hypothetical protein